MNPDGAAALVRLLGPHDPEVFRSSIPIEMGGAADVLQFRSFVQGIAYVTCEMAAQADQAPGLWERYELMMCTREDTLWAASAVGQLAALTFDQPFRPGGFLDIEGDVPEGSTVTAVLFDQPDLPPASLPPGETTFGILLCIGITSDEFEACQSQGPRAVLERLRARHIFPFTDLKRPSVL
jgi:hypothetical protein